jgi:fatty acid-binding protein DegV
METFRSLASKGYDVLHVSPIPAVTRMYDTAALGRRLAYEDGIGERIEILDSGTATMAQGSLVREAARLALAGKGMEEILARLHSLSASISLLVTLDTLEYLAKTSVPSRRV